MDFDSTRLFYVTKALKAPVGCYGYFSNNLASIKKAVKEERQGKKSIYARLDYVLNETEEHRFGCKHGNFALFYVMGENFNTRIL